MKHLKKRKLHGYDTRIEFNHPNLIFCSVKFAIFQMTDS